MGTQGDSNLNSQRLSACGSLTCHVSPLIGCPPEAHLWFYHVLNDHADCKSSTHSLRYQGSDGGTEETLSRKKTQITKNSIFSIQAISQLKSWATIAPREYWPYLLQSCGSTFYSYHWFSHVLAIKSILWMVHLVYLNASFDSLKLLGPGAVPFLAKTGGMERCLF